MMLKLRYSLQFICLLVWLTNITEGKYKCKKPNIEISVAPVSKKLQVHWEIEDNLFRNGDWIGLYRGNTDTNNPTHNRKHVFKLNGHKGWATSGIKFEEQIEKDFSNPKVMQWRAIYWRPNGHGKREDALVTTKLSTFPNWMEYYWSTLHNRPLNEIFIPGTHDSVCDETIDIRINAGLTKPRSLNKAFGSFKNLAIQAVGAVGPVNKLTMTQDMDILEQLLLGIRYLDIRVIFNTENKEFWGGHGGVKIIKLENVINQVKEFAAKTDKELIIFDLHQFMEMDNDENKHQDLIKFLKEKFTDNGRTLWISPDGKSWRSTLEGALKDGRKIIVSYNNHNIVNKFGRGMLWYPVKQLWGDKDKFSDLKTYFEQTFAKITKPGNDCQAAMAQLTPKMDTAGKIIGNLKNGLSAQAEENADDVYDLFMTDAIGLKTNILATDYFMGQGTVRQAFIWNRRKFQADQNNKHCDPQEAYVDEYYQHNIFE